MKFPKKLFEQFWFKIMQVYILESARTLKVDKNRF